MIKRLLSRFKKPEITPAVAEKPERPRPFNYYDQPMDTGEHEKLERLWEANFSNPDGYGIGHEAWVLQQEQAQ